MSITAKSKGGFQVEISDGSHVWIADEPVELGGDYAGPGTYDLLLSSLAACTIITLHMYANRKGWPLESVEIKMSTEKVLARDCEDCESDPNIKVDIIEKELKIQGDLDEDQLARLAQIADRCPIHRSLISETKIRAKSLSND